MTPAALCSGHDFTHAARVKGDPPALYFEIAPPDWSALWSLPNTFPLISADVRQSYSASVWPGITWVGTPGAEAHVSPADFGIAVANHVTSFFANCPAWPAGKPRRWAMCLRGFDEPGSDIFVGQHPSDRYAANLASPFSQFARGDLNAWGATAFVELASRLVIAGQRTPDKILADCEGIGDVIGASGEWAAVIADARYSDPAEQINNTQTLKQWVDSYVGSAPTYNAGHSAYHPANFEYQGRLEAAVYIAYLTSLKVLFNYARVSFPGLPCGNWLMYTNDSGSKAVTRRPAGEKRHWMRGFFAGTTDVQIPAMYSAPADLRTDADGAVVGDPDPGWESYSNWFTEFPAAGSGTLTQKLRRAGSLVLQRQIPQLKASTSAGLIVPSLSLSAGDPAGEWNDAADVMAGAINACSALGVAAHWVFAQYTPLGTNAPWGDTPATIRAAYVRMVQAAGAGVIG